MSDGRVHHARNGDVRLAYRVFGDAGPTLVWVPGWVVNNVDNYDEAASPYAMLIEHISRSARLVIMDQRGTGLSDPVTHPPSLDERVDDLRAVLNAIGADRPTLVGSGEGGPICSLFAAIYPERVHSLIMWGKTVLFTDIVSSTEQLGAVGDARWRHQLDNHDKLVDATLTRYGGVRANHMGDGIFAVFDGPNQVRARCWPAAPCAIYRPAQDSCSKALAGNDSKDYQNKSTSSAFRRTRPASVPS